MLIVSHRGYSKTYGENTYLGINHAFTLEYVDAVEFDVRVTKDKKFVLIHDFFIDRVSNGTGLVNKMTLRKLRKYNFGTNNYPSKITTLKKVLSINTNKIFMIELKMNDKEYFKIKNKLIKLLFKYKNKNIYIASFNKTIIIDLMKTNLNLKYGIISTKNIKNNNVDFYSLNYNFFNDKIYSKIKDKLIFLWTLNNKDDINKVNKYINNSNFGIITDNPKIFIK